MNKVKQIGDFPLKHQNNYYCHTLLCAALMNGHLSLSPSLSLFGKNG